MYSFNAGTPPANATRIESHARPSVRRPATSRSYARHRISSATVADAPAPTKNFLASGRRGAKLWTPLACRNHNVRSRRCVAGPRYYAAVAIPRLSLGPIATMGRRPARQPCAASMRSHLANRRTGRRQVRKVGGGLSPHCGTTIGEASRWTLAAFDPLELVFKPLTQHGAIRQICQRIVPGHVHNALFRPLAVGDVLVGRDPSPACDRLVRKGECATVCSLCRTSRCFSLSDVFPKAGDVIIEVRGIRGPTLWCSRSWRRPQPLVTISVDRPYISI